MKDLQNPAYWEECEMETAQQNPKGAWSKSSSWSQWESCKSLNQL